LEYCFGSEYAFKCKGTHNEERKVKPNPASASSDG